MVNKHNNKDNINFMKLFQNILKCFEVKVHITNIDWSLLTLIIKFARQNSTWGVKMALVKTENISLHSHLEYILLWNNKQY